MEKTSLSCSCIYYSFYGPIHPSPCTALKGFCALLWTPHLKLQLGITLQCCRAGDLTVLFSRAENLCFFFSLLATCISNSMLVLKLNAKTIGFSLQPYKVNEAWRQNFLHWDTCVNKHKSFKSLFKCHSRLLCQLVLHVWGPQSLLLKSPWHQESNALKSTVSSKSCKYCPKKTINPQKPLSTQNYEPLVKTSG